MTSEHDSKKEDRMTVDEMAGCICRAAVGAILIGHILTEMNPPRGKDRGREKRHVVNMCASTMKKSELKESKRQTRLIMRRYGGIR